MGEHCNFLFYVYCTLFAPKSGLTKYLGGGSLAHLN
jgi:hypothetical protein